MKTLNDIADFNEIFPDATPQQKYWMAEYGSIMKDRGIAETLTQKDAEVAEERKRIENDVLAPLYEKIDGWYKERYDIVGQGALASVFEEALKALTPNPTEGTSDKSN